MIFDLLGIATTDLFVILLAAIAVVEFGVIGYLAYRRLSGKRRANAQTSSAAADGSAQLGQTVADAATTQSVGQTPRNYKEVKEIAKKNRIKESKGDIVYYVICGFILFLLAVIVIYPLYYIVIASISDADAVMSGDVWLYPVKLTFSGYGSLFQRDDVWRGYFNTIAYTVLGTVFNVVLTIPAGWALSREYLPFRKLITTMLIITMFFGGGLVPYIIVCRALGLYQNPLILIIGGGVSVYNVFMCKSFFSSNVPKEVLEAAQIDGAGEVRTFFDLILPISTSIISVMVLFYAVGHWNNYIDAYIFNIDKSFYPLQTVLDGLLSATNVGEGDVVVEQMRIATQVKFTSIIVATVPILVLYPMIEKHFGQGVLVGSFK